MWYTVLLDWTKCFILYFSETRDQDQNIGDQEQGAGESLEQQGDLAQQQRAHRSGPRWSLKSIYEMKTNQDYFIQRST